MDSRAWPRCYWLDSATQLIACMLHMQQCTQLKTLVPEHTPDRHLLISSSMHAMKHAMCDIMPFVMHVPMYQHM